MEKLANYVWLLVSISWASQIQSADEMFKIIYALVAWIALINYIEGDKRIDKGEKK